MGQERYFMEFKMRDFSREIKINEVKEAGGYMP